MYEVEAKVRLSKTDYERLKKAVAKFAKPSGRSLIKDRYFGTAGAYFLRIREKDGKGFLNLKDKKRERGMELNQEIELPLVSSAGFRRLLGTMDIPLVASKAKRREAFRHGPFQIELNTVAGLGRFLEVETLVRRRSDIPSAKKNLVALFGKLGFKPKDFEKHYYLEMLGGKTAKQ